MNVALESPFASLWYVILAGKNLNVYTWYIKSGHGYLHTICLMHDENRCHMNEGALCHNSRSRNYERHISIAVVVKGPVLKQSRARGSSAVEELSSGSGYTGECVFERRPGRVEDRAAASLVVPSLSHCWPNGLSSTVGAHHTSSQGGVKIQLQWKIRIESKGVKLKRSCPHSGRRLI